MNLSLALRLGRRSGGFGPPPDVTAPSAPTLSALVNGDGTQSFTVSLPGEGETLMHVYRDTSATATTLLETVAAASSYSHAGTNGTTYYYRVRLEDAAGNVSGYSNEISGAPAPPALTADSWYHAGTPTWPVAALPSALAGGCLAARANGDLHFVAGTTHLRYRPSLNTWVALAALPASRVYAQAGFVGDKLYVTGGFDGSTVQGTTWEYDPANDGGGWTARATNGTPRQRASACVHGSKLWVLGGRPAGGSGGTLTAMSYDPAGDTWASSSNLSAGDSEWGAAVSDGTYIWLLRGGSGSTPTEAFVRYNPSGGASTTASSRAAAAIRVAGGLLQGRFHVVGGRSAAPAAVATHDSNTLFSTATAWATTPADLPVARQNAVAAVSGGALYVVGGSDGTTDSANVYAYVPAEGATRPY